MQVKWKGVWTKWQQFLAGNTLRSVSPAGNRCHFVLLDKDESCPTADLSNIGRPNGPAYSTGELLNVPLDFKVMILFNVK